MTPLFTSMSDLSLKNKTIRIKTSLKDLSYKSHQLLLSQTNLEVKSQNNIKRREQASFKERSVRIAVLPFTPSSAVSEASGEHFQMFGFLFIFILI